MSTPIDRMMDGLEWDPVQAPGELEEDVPYATHEAILDLGHPIPKLKCYQLSNGVRVIDAEDIKALFGVWGQT